jgi:hypothetical protein
MHITVAARSEEWNVFTRSNTGVMGSSPIRGMDICVQTAALRRAEPHRRSPTGYVYD